MIRMLRTTVMLLLLAVSSAATAASPAAAPRPNIVFILADDLGWNDVGYHGSEIRTPNIDRLAGAGVRLEQFYVQQVCTPTRAALMTGRYPFRYGLQRHVVMVMSRYGLALEERTLPAALKDAGYRTAICGKWHLGHHDPAYLPQNRGFDLTYGMYWGRIDYFSHEIDQPKHEPGIGLDWHRNGRPLREEGYSTTLIGQQAARWIKEHDPSSPLFMYVPFNAPHSPMDARAADLRAYAHITDGRRRTVAAMVTAMDEAVGMILTAIEEKGMRDTTLIVFSSDNGGHRGFGASNQPLRGGKNTLYEGGLRVPCVAVWSGQLRSRAVDTPVHMVDWYPTLLRLAGASLDQPLPIDGEDLWPVMTQDVRSLHEEIVLNVDGEQGAIRRGQWKLVRNEPTRPARQIEFELFDLQTDPGESNNVAEAHPQVVAELAARLGAHVADSRTPLQVVTGDKRPQQVIVPKIIGVEEQ